MGPGRHPAVMLLAAAILAPTAILAPGSLSAQPQPTAPAWQASASPAQAPAPAWQGPDVLLSAAQLDQLTAPIALYPDALLGQVLAAATYPLEVVEAHRWLQDPANAALRGNALAAALAQQSWDISVRSLVPFAPVLAMMDAHLDWTELLGETFLAQQAAVMDSIQRLRARAAAAGTLTSTPQQNIATLGPDIDIEPAEADMAYVPYYDPDSAYGTWPWPDDPPFAWTPPDGIGPIVGTTVDFGPPVVLLPALWDWIHWHWREHLLQVGSLAGTAHLWHHNPRHRLGVPYRNALLAARYQARSLAAARDLRRHALRLSRAPLPSPQQLVAPERSDHSQPPHAPTRLRPGALHAPESERPAASAAHTPAAASYPTR